MKQKNKQILIGLVLIIGILFITQTNFLSIIQGGSSISPNSPYLYQYAKNGDCEDMPGYIWNPTSKVKTYSSNFEFNVINTAVAESTMIEGGKVVQSFCGTNIYKIEVRKDGRLIDTINPGNLLENNQQSSTKTGLSCQEISDLVDKGGIKKAYSDDGQIYNELPEGKTGINILFGSSTWARPCGNQRIVQVVNTFEMVYPDALKIEFKEAQKTGNELKVILSLDSKISGNTDIELELIPDGLLKRTIKQSKNIQLSQGVSEITFNFNTDEEIKDLSIKANTKVYVSTSGFSNLNADYSVYNDGDESIKSLSSHNRIKIQKFSTGSERLLNITEVIKQEGIPGKTIPSETQTPDTSKAILYILGIVILLIILIVIYIKIRRR